MVIVEYFPLFLILASLLSASVSKETNTHSLTNNNNQTHTLDTADSQWMKLLQPSLAFPSLPFNLSHKHTHTLSLSLTQHTLYS